MLLLPLAGVHGATHHGAGGVGARPAAAASPPCAPEHARDAKEGHAVPAAAWCVAALSSEHICLGALVKDMQVLRPGMGLSFSNSVHLLLPALLVVWTDVGLQEFWAHWANRELGLCSESSAAV